MSALLLLIILLALFCYVAFSRGGPSKAGSRAPPPPPPHRIADNFSSLASLKAALHDTQLENCNLIVAVDFTKSNEWTGKASYGGKNLHAPGGDNQYEAALSLCESLSEFDEDGLIPAYGFGDASTRAGAVFSFLPGDAPCAGLRAVLDRYRALAPRVALSGGTSFAPAIRKACALVAAASPPSFHILIIVCDGQVSDECRAATVAAIVEASAYPLSIVCVGVGDGPWGEMQRFDDDVPARGWDNFQFVPLVATLRAARRSGVAAAEAFALAALMEVPEGYAACKRLGLVGARAPPPTPVRTLEPPAAGGGGGGGDGGGAPPPPPPRAASPAGGGAPAAPQCSICLHNPVDRVFSCGHTICGACEGALQRRVCHVCRAAAPRSAPLFL